MKDILWLLDRLWTLILYLHIWNDCQLMPHQYVSRYWCTDLLSPQGCLWGGRSWRRAQPEGALSQSTSHTQTSQYQHPHHTSPVTCAHSHTTKVHNRRKIKYVCQDFIFFLQGGTAKSCLKYNHPCCLSCVLYIVLAVLSRGAPLVLDSKHVLCHPTLIS